MAIPQHIKTRASDPRGGGECTPPPPTSLPRNASLGQPSFVLESAARSDPGSQVTLEGRVTTIGQVDSSRPNGSRSSGPPLPPSQTGRDRTMSDPLTYELQETIHGVTFTYRTRGEDPLVMEGFGRTNSGGDYEDMLLSAVGDESCDADRRRAPHQLRRSLHPRLPGKGPVRSATRSTRQARHGRETEERGHPDSGRSATFASGSIRRARSSTRRTRSGRRHPRRVRRADAPRKHVPDRLESGDPEIHRVCS